MQKFTGPPKAVKGAAAGPGKKKTSGHAIGGLFRTQSLQKTEPDSPPRRSGKERAARMSRLKNTFI